MFSFLALFIFITAISCNDEVSDLEDDSIDLFLQSLAKPFLITIFCPSFSPLKIKFLLYTRKQRKAHLMRVGKTQEFNTSTYDPAKQTKIIIHGWFQEGESFAHDMKEAYLNKEDVNVISVDWSPYASCLYIYTKNNVISKVGGVVAEMINELVAAGSSIQSFHLIGHSFGAHIASFAGKAMAPVKLPRITGLDPAGVIYSTDDATRRLDKTDAEFVDIIHTNARSMGTDVISGHVDFYVNGGRHQYACEISHDVACSHQLSVAYYTESVINPNGFCAIKASSYVNYLTNHCAGNLEKLYMGSQCSTSANGTYYLLARDCSPYAVECPL